MNVYLRIILIWLVALALAGLAFLVLPNEGPSASALLVDSILLLAGIVCVFVSAHEPNRSNKPIFLNFAVFFLLSLLAFAYRFIGYAISPGNEWLRFFFSQYHLLTYFFLLSFSVVYVVVDSLFTDFKTPQKYLLAFLIVGSTFAYYYYPYFENPRFLYSTEEVANYKTASSAVTSIEIIGKVDPTPEEIAPLTSLGVWKDGRQVGFLFEDQKVKRLRELLPYVKDENNFASLLFRPLYLNNIYMNVLCVVFIFLFFGYQYKNDPPQGAYIEKIIFLFLPYCSLEILHHYAYIKSVEYATLIDVQQIGYYLTLLNLLLLLVFFGLRLRFITSVKGEFYERELVSDAEHISRWRDAFDNLVVRHFLNPKAVHGRLFASRSPRNEA